MASGRTVTIEELIANIPVPTLVLRQPLNASGNSSVSGSTGQSVLDELKNDLDELVKDIKESSESTVQEMNRISEEKRKGATPDVTERNIEKFLALRNNHKKSFDSAFNKQTEKGAKAMKNMSEKEQEKFIGFWESAGSFLMDVMEWVGKIADAVANLLQQGAVLIVRGAELVFRAVYSSLDTIGNWFLNLFQ